MALYYQWSWDVSLLTSGLSLPVTDNGGSFTVAFTTGTYCHTSISSVKSGYTAFASALQTALNAGTASGRTYTVGFSAVTADYSISLSGVGASFSMTFVGSDARTNIARILGFTANTGSASSHSSTVRPYYLIIPAIQGRSLMSDEYEPDGMTFEATSDGGDAHQVSKDSDEVWSDWVQQAETATAPSLSYDPGTPVYERHATSTVPWTYQAAWRHSRTGDLPFLVVDGSEQAVHQLRADGSSLKPTRFASQDYALWSVGFKTRLLGRL